MPSEPAIACTVEAVFPFGVFVRAADGRKYYIRRREMTLSGVADPRSLVAPGQQLRAVPIPADGSTPELSVRAALPDPWLEFARSRRPGDVVAATVKHLFADGALVEVLPGVDGYIPTREMTTSNSPVKPDDILWPGDHVEAAILKLDLPHKRLVLSIRRRIAQLTRAEVFKAQMDRATRETADEGEGEAPVLPSDVTRIDLADPVLVVEDRADIREPLLAWLWERGCEAHGAASGEEAIELCRSRPFAFGLFDLDIPGMNGVSTIRKLRELQVKMPIAVMSGPDLIAEQWPKLQPLDVVACFPKPVEQDDLLRTLLHVSRGESPEMSAEFARATVEDDIIAFQNLAEAMRGEDRIEARLRVALRQLVDDTRADKGIIFRFDPASNRVSIAAEAGQQRANKEATYLLMESPVKDVIRESRVFIEDWASSVRTARLRNLEALLSFEAALGVPLEAGGRTEYALFLFARLPNAFTHTTTRRQALSAAQLMQALLESRILEQRLEATSGVMLSGHLSSAFGHEVFNKIQSLDLQMSNLAQRLGQLPEDSAANDLWPELEKARETAAGTMQAVTDLKKTVRDFQQMMRNTDEQCVDVNGVLAITKSQLRLLAQRQGIRIDLDLDPDLPLARVNPVRIQQVFINLMLNAIQQLGEMDDPERRVLHVSSRRADDEKGPRVHVRFNDTGPGIHRQLWDKIFALGFTTRDGGSGLGLFIARSLVQSMGGRIGVEESLVPMGATFLIELPAAADS